MGEDLLGLAKGVTGVAGAGVTAGAALGSGELDPVSLVGDAASKAAGDAIEGKAEEFLWDLAQSAVDGTQVVFHMIVDLMFQITAPQVTGEFIYVMGGRIFFISLPLIVMFAAVRIIVSSLRAQALTGARDAFLGAGASVLGTVALVPLTSLAVRAVDGVADGLLTATLLDGDQFVDDVMAAVVQFGTAVGNMVGDQKIAGPIAAWDVPAGGVIATSIICLIAVGLLMLACVFIGLALVLRNMLLYIVVVVGPLCLSGLSWEPTRRWASIWFGWMVALIFTKLAVVVVMGLGVLAITATFISGEITANVLPSLTTVFSGIVMLGLAGFMPIACFALFGWMGEGGVRELQVAASGAGSMLASVPASALSAGQSAGGRLNSVINGAGGGGGTGSGGSSSPGLVGGGDGPGPEDAAAGVDAAAPLAEAAPAAGATAATAGLAAPAVVAGEVASEVGDVAEEAGDAVAEGAKETIDDATSETPGEGAASGTPSDDSSYSYEQPAQDEVGTGGAAGEGPAPAGTSDSTGSDVPVADSSTDAGPAEGTTPAEEPAPAELPAGAPGPYSDAHLSPEMAERAWSNGGGEEGEWLAREGADRDLQARDEVREMASPTWTALPGDAPVSSGDANGGQ